MSDSTSWAEAEFGHAELGDPRRTARLVKVAAEVARRPAGTVLQACATSASREGAFRLLENGAVHPGDVREAMVRATARKCANEKRVFVAIDGTSLGLTDNARSKGLGGVGAWTLGGRGVQVMTALAVEQDGSALGICGQRMWSRATRSRHGRHGAKGATSENTVWLELLRETHREFAEAAPACLPWFQMDRGADCWQVLELSAKLDLLMTVRATHDRRTDQGASRLWSTLQRGPVLAKRKVQVSARAPGWRKKRVKGKRIKVKTPARRPRLATVAIRATTVAIECTTETGRKFTVNINAVLVSEVNRSSKDKLEWMLLTTHPVRTRLNALEVVRGYTLRWRIEEFHRLWKTGLCCVEDTQLRSRDAIFKWATILAAVATRAMRITHLARSTPDVPASTEFTPIELKALIALRQPNDVEDDHVPTLAVAVRWIADLGGYTGPWNGLPGAIVIGRGLYDLSIATRVFENRRKKR